MSLGRACFQGEYATSKCRTRVSDGFADEPALSSDDLCVHRCRSHRVKRMLTVKVEVEAVDCCAFLAEAVTPFKNLEGYNPAGSAELPQQSSKRCRRVQSFAVSQAMVLSSHLSLGPRHSLQRVSRAHLHEATGL